jgi:hypothetical protein
MALAMLKLYKVLKQLGATDEDAGTAAEELGTMDSRLHGIESEVRLLRWMVGIIGTLSIGLHLATLGVLLTRVLR